MSDEHAARMVATLPAHRLPDNVVRWRVNRMRDDGTWAKGEWIEGSPPRPVEGGPSDLLEYDLRQLTPHRVTILGDTVRDWSIDGPEAGLATFLRGL